MGQRLRLLISFFGGGYKYGHSMNMYNVYFMSLEPIVNLLPLVVRLSSVNNITFFYFILKTTVSKHCTLLAITCRGRDPSLEKNLFKLFH